MTTSLASISQAALASVQPRELPPRSKRKVRRRFKVSKEVVLARLRIANLKTFYWDQFGGPLPDTEQGRACISCILDHVLEADYADPVAQNIVDTFAPWLPDGDRETMIDAAYRDPRFWTPDDLAEAIELKYADRQRLKLWSLGAIDRKRAARQIDRRQRDKDRQAAKRQVAGATPRSQSYSQTKPWLEAGFNSRRTWERHRRKSEQPETSFVRDDTVRRHA